MTTPNYLTVRQVAARLQVSRSNIYSLVGAGQLPTIRVGLGRGTIRIAELDVIAFEARLRRDDVREVTEHFGFAPDQICRSCIGRGGK